MEFSFLGNLEAVACGVLIPRQLGGCCCVEFSFLDNLEAVAVWSSHS